MVGLGNQLASLIPALFVMKLVIVCFSRFFQWYMSLMWSPHWQDFEGPFCYQRRNWALLTPRTVIACMIFLYGTISLPSEWRWILCGNQSGLSWRGCTSFNATWPLLIQFGSFSIVSPMCFLSSYAHFFVRSNGANFRGNRVSEGILRRWRFVKLTYLILTQGRSNLFYVQYSRLLGLVLPRASLTYTPCFELYSLMCNSDPHATNVGRVESERPSVHHASSPLQRLLGFRFHHHSSIW